MRSRVLRLTLAATLLVAAAGTAAFLVHSEQTLATARETLRDFDQRSRETVDVLSDARVAQQAYVAAGQGLDYWVPRTATLIDATHGNVQALQKQARSPEAIEALQDAAAAVADLTEIDTRARDYLQTGQSLMAGDVIFTEGESTASAAARQVEAARLSERQAAEATEASLRRLEAGSLAGFGVYAILVTALLTFAGRSTEPEASATDSAVAAVPELSLQASKLPEPRPDDTLAALRTAAELCSAFGQVANVEEMKALMSRVANSLGASGVIVWVGTADGADLRPAVAHGYTPQTLSRMPAIPRTADNAAAAAYRTGSFQVVRATHNAPGAVVAPLLVPGGCLGALTAEVRAGTETSEAVRALTTLFAAQLSGILSTPAREQEPIANKTAAG